MLTFYLSTVVVWMIIIFCAIFMFKDKLIEKSIAMGMKIESKKSGFFSSFGWLFVLAAIPVFRLIILIAVIYMAGCSQEEFEELMSNAKSKQ